MSAHLAVGPTWGWELGDLKISPDSSYVQENQPQPIIKSSSSQPHELNGAQSIQISIQSVQWYTIHSDGTHINRGLGPSRWTPLWAPSLCKSVSNNRLHKYIYLWWEALTQEPLYEHHLWVSSFLPQMGPQWWIKSRHTRHSPMNWHKYNSDTHPTITHGWTNLNKMMFSSTIELKRP